MSTFFRLLTISCVALLLVQDIAAQRTSGIGIGLFPNLSHRRLVAFDVSAQQLTDSLEMFEMGVPTYSAGLLLNFRGEKAGVQIGLQYSVLGYNGSRRTLAASDPNSANFSERAQHFRSQQIEVPMSLQFYQDLSDKDDFFFSLGTSVSYSLSNDDIEILYAGDISERNRTAGMEDFRRLNVAFQTAMGWEHNYQRNWAISVAPTFKLWLRGLYNTQTLNRNLYQVGLRLTVRRDRVLE